MKEINEAEKALQKMAELLPEAQKAYPDRAEFLAAVLEGAKKTYESGSIGIEQYYTSRAKWSQFPFGKYSEVYLAFMRAMPVNSWIRR